MEGDKDRAIAALAERHHGVFTSEQTAHLGFADHHREHRLRTGRWVNVHATVYRFAGTPLTWRGSVLAACWSTAGLAAASHRTAGALWELPGGAEHPVEITCARGKRAFVHGLLVHESKVLAQDDIITRDHIPVMRIEDTLLGLAAVLLPSAVEIALDRALQRKLTTSARLDEFLRRKGARGRNGIGVLRSLLEAHDPLAGLPESAMETLLKRLLRRSGLPTPVFQYVIRHAGRFVARVDAAYPELRIAIEFDSYEHHTGKRAIVRDNDRRNRLKRIRWQTVTFTAADLQRDGGDAIEALIVARRDALAAT
jgi:hypothetical protein